jgi:hypothetical protein
VSGDAVAVAAVIGAFVVAAVVAWGIFAVARTAVSHDKVEAREAALAELTESHRQLLQGQKEAAELLTELRGTTMRIEAMLREVG